LSGLPYCEYSACEAAHTLSEVWQTIIEVWVGLIWRGQSAAVGHLDGSGNLSAIVAADRTFPAAVADRSQLNL
jgi:hypothetical protein